jgi:hypothetical protein
MSDTIILVCEAAGEREFSLTHAQGTLREQAKWRKLPQSQTWEIKEGQRFEFTDGELKLKAKPKRNADNAGDKGEN